MPIFRPDQACLRRRFAALLASTFCLSSALSAPDAPGSMPGVAAPASTGNGATATGSPGGSPSGDPLPRPLADTAPSATSTSTIPPDSTELPPDDSRFVDRVRDQASNMVLTAMNFLGVPYRRGGNDADHGFDCSGFTRHIFEMSLGLVLPRRADQQASGAGLLHIGREQLKPGDLVFFNTMRRTFSHVGIYVGAGKFIHSPKPGGEVRVDDLHAAYWEKRFTGGRRADPVSTPATADPTTASARTLN